MARPSLTPIDVELMRSRLAEAALAIYLRDGLEAVSFRRLADAVGISHTLPYRYIDDKDALLARVRTDCFRRFDAFLRERETPSAPSAEHVRSIARAYIAYAQEHPEEYRLMFSSEQPPPDRYPALLAARQSVFDHAASVVRRHLDIAGVEGDARLLTNALWAALHGLMSLHVANQLVHGARYDELVDPMLDRILAPSPREVPA